MKKVRPIVFIVWVIGQLERPFPWGNGRFLLPITVGAGRRGNMLAKQMASSPRRLALAQWGDDAHGGMGR